MTVDQKKISELSPLIKEKDEQALKEFFYLMQPEIFRFLFRYTGDRALAEDLVQETFVKFWLSIDNLDVDKLCKAYLYRIARNLAINNINRRPPFKYIGDEENFLSLLNNTQNEVNLTFFMDDFQKAINSLPERCKATFLFSRISGFDYSEIAEIMNVSLQTVKNQMNKALAVLRKRLKNHLD
ncbi:MAG: RNA polymerase sigma factor [Melioribacter sp.]|nr:RNA polymerase sigma factor [Melioribacter sp.]